MLTATSSVWSCDWSQQRAVAVGDLEIACLCSRSEARHGCWQSILSVFSKTLLCSFPAYYRQKLAKETTMPKTLTKQHQQKDKVGKQINKKICICWTWLHFLWKFRRAHTVPERYPSGWLSPAQQTASLLIIFWYVSQTNRTVNSKPAAANVLPA